MNYNMIDYLKWRGDIPFNSDLNEIDNIVFSRISYFKLSNVEEIQLDKAYKLKDLMLEDQKLFLELSTCNRYKDIIISNVKNKFDKKEEIQFFALTFLLPNEEMYVAFRGTDSSFVGLKEDFNMSFSDTVASSSYAVNYLNEVSMKYPSRRIYIGGHSKGGNLAIYASMNANNDIKTRIIKIFNNDGPGFQEKIIESDNYKSVLDKIITYVPQTSIVGRLLNHEEGYKIIKSSAKGIKEHSLYTWNVLGSKFIYEQSLTKESNEIEDIISKWLSALSIEERSNVINVLYDVLMSANVTEPSDFNTAWFQKTKIIINSYQNVSKEDKKMIGKVFRYLLSIMKNNIFKK